MSPKKTAVALRDARAATGNPPPAETASPSGATLLEVLQHAIDHAGHLLPAQGPITVFIHHNTLHAFEDLAFDEGVKKGGKLFGCAPYLSEERYRQELAKGRIREVDLIESLREELGANATEPVLQFGTRLDLRLAMLRYPLWLAPAAELRWFVAETDALKRYRKDVPAPHRERFLRETQHWVMRDVRGTAEEGRAVQPNDRRPHQALADLFAKFGERNMERWNESTWEAFSLQALWRVCRDGVHGVKPIAAPTYGVERHRDVLLEATGEDTDRGVHDLLIRFCSAFLDQGFASWELPARDQGFFHSFSALYRQAGGPPDAWLQGLASELSRIQSAGLSPLQSILESLQLLGVPEAEWDPFLTATLLALRGWGGMIRQMELRADRVAHPVPPGSVVEFLATRLILERLALAHLAQSRLNFTGPLAQLRQVAKRAIPHGDASHVDQRAFVVFQLAQSLGWTPGALYQLSKADWNTLLQEIETFNSLERRTMFHRAFERKYRNQTLDAVAVQARQTTERITKAKFQTIHCIDEREESFRRHLEELEPQVETFGAAGFFSVAMYYRGAAEAHFVPLCPIVVRPQHWVKEDVVLSFEEEDRRRAQARKALGTASHQFHMGSRTFTGGILAAGLGVLASIPLVARVLFPRFTARLKAKAHSFVSPPSISRLQLERTQVTPGNHNGAIGFSLPEMVDIAERLLRDIGLIQQFSRLIFVLGHGSSSVNNPHRSAYECGACGGNAGGPNARALAQILNDLRVRQALQERGLPIPAETVFVGGMHNTCSDAVTYSDLDRLPHSHIEDFQNARKILERSADRNAHERCRRFASAPLTMSFAMARAHVEARSEDLAQTRPECGHATNAVCVVGRRSRTKGLFMDRRSFLVSYDPTQDNSEAEILARILGAVVPVCGGINLEYYFSYVDSPGWGCGTKLPHNVTSLLGIMEGAVSDLRPGLPWQMVEIHDPVRLMLICETKPELLQNIIQKYEGIGKVCKNGWVQIATLDPVSNQLHLFRGGKFEPYEPEGNPLPTVKSSADWYRGWREHLGYAAVSPGRPVTDNV